MPLNAAELEELKKQAEEARQKRAAETPPPDPNAKRWGISDAWAERREQLMKGSNGLTELEVKEMERRAQVHGRGHTIARVFRAGMCAELNRWHGEDGIIRVLHDVYDDKLTAKIWAQNMEKALSVEKPSEGGYLLGETYSDDFIELVRPSSTLLSLGATVVPMDGGSLVVRRQTAGTNVTWAGENDAVDADTGPRFGDVKLSTKKAVAIVVVSNDLLRAKSARADQIVERDARAEVSVELDRVGFVGAGSEHQPLGVLKDPDITNITLNAQLDSDTLTTFLSTLMAANVDLGKGLMGRRNDDMSNDLSRFAWTFNATIFRILYNLKVGDVYTFRDEMNKGMLLGFPFAVTNHIPTAAAAYALTTIAFGDWSELWYGQQGSIEFDTSREAAYNEGGVVKAAYSRDQSVMRIIAKVDVKYRQLAKMVKSDTVRTAAS